MGLLQIARGLLAQPVFALGMSALSILLLVVVLLAVPGPVRGLYWFSMASPVEGASELRAGVLGWCWAEVSREAGRCSDDEETKRNATDSLAFFNCAALPLSDCKLHLLPSQVSLTRKILRSNA